MDVFISVNGENKGFIEVWEGIKEKEFMQKVREVTKINLEMKEDLDLRLLVRDEVINFSLDMRELSGKFDTNNFIRNQDPNLLDDFLNVFHIDDEINGYTALMYSSVRGNIEMVKLLIKRGANIRYTKSLFLACYEGHIEVVKFLIEKGVNIESEDDRYTTVLNIASKKGYKELVKFLISKKAKIESNDINEMTPLNNASKRGHKEVVELLLDEGANIESKDFRGMGPLDNALKEGHKEVVELLYVHSTIHYLL